MFEMRKKEWAFGLIWKRSGLLFDVMKVQFFVRVELVQKFVKKNFLQMKESSNM